MHIGSEKTGSKTLQAFLHRNRQTLLNRGILYTRSAGLRNNRQISLLGYPPNRRDDTTMQLGINSKHGMQAHQRELSKALSGEIASRSLGVDRLIFSSEHLQSRLRTLEDIGRLRDQLGNIGLKVVQVIVYLRDPVAICRSLYASSVMTGSKAAGPPPPGNPYFATVCDHRKTLKNWAFVFGVDTVIPRLFERDFLRGGSIIDDFCNTAGVTLDNDLVRPADRNESLSFLGVEVLRRINVQVPRIVDGVVDEDRRQLVELVRQHCTGPRYEAPAEVVTEYGEYFAESNEWVRNHYFPDRKTLFKPAEQASLACVNASEAELDGLAGLVTALWKSFH